MKLFKNWPIIWISSKYLEESNNILIAIYFQTNERSCFFYVSYLTKLHVSRRRCVVRLKNRNAFLLQNETRIKLLDLEKVSDVYRFYTKNFPVYPSLIYIIDHRCLWKRDIFCSNYVVIFTFFHKAISEILMKIIYIVFNTISWKRSILLP